MFLHNICSLSTELSSLVFRTIWYSQEEWLPHRLLLETVSIVLIIHCQEFLVIRSVKHCNPRAVPAVSLTLFLWACAEEECKFPNCFSCSFCLFWFGFWIFETGSHYVTQTDLELTHYVTQPSLQLTILLPQPLSNEIAEVNYHAQPYGMQSSCPFPLPIEQNYPTQQCWCTSEPGSQDDTYMFR